MECIIAAMRKMEAIELTHGLNQLALTLNCFNQDTYLIFFSNLNFNILSFYILVVKQMCV